MTEHRWVNDGIGCGRCYTYMLSCDRPDCPANGGIRIAFAPPRWWQLRYRFNAWRDRRRTRHWIPVDEWLERQ